MKIKSAAILYKNTIYEGKSHCEIGLQMIKNGVCKPPCPSGKAQGFITDCGKFVNRSQALKIAIKAQQVKPFETIHHKWLFSEDLRKDD